MVGVAGGDRGSRRPGNHVGQTREVLMDGGVDVAVSGNVEAGRIELISPTEMT